MTGRLINKLIDMNNSSRIVLSLILVSIYFIMMVNTLSSVWIIFLILILLTPLTHVILSEMKKYNKNLELDNLSIVFIKSSGIKYDDYAISKEHNSGILISESDEKIYILSRNDINEKYQINTYNFKDIVESGIIEDGKTLNHTSKSGLIGGALIGGFLAGGVGALIGGMGASTTSAELTNKLTLIVVVDNLVNPVHSIVFSNIKGQSKDNHMYKMEFEKCNLWHKRMSVIIKRNER